MKDYSTRMTLIQRIKNRMDHNSWEEFAHWYTPYINAILYRSGVPYDTVEDLCQEILVRVWKGIENFEYDPAKCRFRHWLATVCKNHIFTFFKNQKKKHDNVEMDEKYLAPDEAKINEYIEQEWQIYIAEKAFEKVKPRFNEKALKAYKDFQKGIDVKITAKEIGVEVNTVYVYSKRVKEAMTREIVLLINELD